MGYVFAGRFRRGFVESLKGSGAETTDATHRAVTTKAHRVVTVDVDVASASGTSPSLVVVVEGSPDGVTWDELGRVGGNGYRAGTTGAAPSGFSGAGQTRGVFPAPLWVRTRSVVGGSSPSFDYTVTAEVS